jgi:hypothetical protein
VAALWSRRGGFARAPACLMRASAPQVFADDLASLIVEIVEFQADFPNNRAAL